MNPQQANQISKIYALYNSFVIIAYIMILTGINEEKWQHIFIRIFRKLCNKWFKDIGIHFPS